MKWYSRHLQLSVTELSAIPQFSRCSSVPVLPEHSMETLHCLMKFKPLNQFKNLLTKYKLNQKVTGCYYLPCHDPFLCCFILLSVENNKRNIDEKSWMKGRGHLLIFGGWNCFLLLRRLPRKNNKRSFLETSHFQIFFYSVLHQIWP